MIEELQKDIDKKVSVIHEKNSVIQDQDRQLKLSSILANAGRLDDLKRAYKNEKYLQTLYVEYKL